MTEDIPVRPVDLSRPLIAESPRLYYTVIDGKLVGVPVEPAT